MSRFRWTFPTAPRSALIALASLFVIAGPGRTAPPVEFNRDIRPILSENCFYCHGPDKNQRKAKLRLDDRAIALAKGAIVPGKPDESELVSRIFSTVADEQMPPPETHKKLTPAQKATLKRWIAEGAEYQPHWAYITPKRPPLPAVKDAGWVRDPIDAFILAGLEEKKVKPSPEADRRTLLRRLSFDLTGLPPTPEEVRAFVADRDPNAYEKQVDRLLASPHYGERMAVAWLDLVRFADTVGYHGDQNQHVFPYRDYVIDSFNANKPFDRFTVEQLAGDLLPNPTPEQLVATGFNRLNMVTREGGAQPNEYLAKYAADRVRTVSITWLGSTMGCCECHDHKFDPFTSKDFYAMEAFFADVKQWGVYADYGYTPNPDLKGVGNDHPFPPEVEVTSPYLVRRMEKLRHEMRQAAGHPSRPAFEAWLREARDFLAKHPDGWATPPATAVGKKGVEVAAQPDGSLLLTGKPVKGEPVLALQAEPGWVAAIRLELLPHPDHQNKVTRDGTDSATIQFAAAVKPADGGKELKLGFFYADADGHQPRYSNGSAVLGIFDRAGWRTLPQRKGERQTAVWLLDKPVRLGDGDQLVVTLTSDNAGCVRLSTSPFAGDEPLRPESLAAELNAALTAEKRTAEQDALLAVEYLRGTAADAAALAKVRLLDKDYFECRGGKAFSLVTQAWEPKVTRVLPRGNWQDESGEVVQPSVPRFLPQPPNPDGHRLTRLDLARWLTAPENPLTARVFVNRLWKQLFGVGLSAVMEDVGAQGEPPVNPALLDWLAVEFRESGWDVKHVVRLMVLSNAYRQDSRARPELRDLDPNNRLVAFQSPRRLDAEFVRDNALSIAGLIDPDVGGPSAKPYQPAGYYANIQFPDRTYVADRDERQYRRGVYVHWQRTFLHPMLANFDAPSREECTANRTVANTPQQALTLLNDPEFVEAARVLAQRVLAGEAANDAGRLERLYELVLARPPKEAERSSLTAFLDGQRSYYQANPADAHKLVHAGIASVPAANESELAAWASICRVVLNLHETITKY
jgi:hypothetical protein